MNIKAVVIVLGVVALNGTTANAADQYVTEMHGFRVEYPKVKERDWQRMQPSLQRQFEIVEAVALPPAVLDYFKTVPVVIVPTLKTGYGHAGVEAGRQIVELKATKLPSDRPILLHELLHAYHGQKIGRSPVIIRAHEEGVKSGMYPAKFAKAHFLENPREYFAVIGTIFLYQRSLEQPPYDCRITARRQPEFIAFLGKHFGPRTCK
jgi:hypothetical protein